MTETKQKGFGILAVLAVVVVLAVVGAIGWSIYSGKKARNNSAAQSTSQATQQSASATTNQVQPAQTDPNAGYVVIKEWGVRFKPVAGLEGLQYFKPTSSAGAQGEDVITFTTDAISQAEPTECSPASGKYVLFEMTRTSQILPERGGDLGKIGDYHFQLRSTGAACGSGKSDKLEGQAVGMIMESLKSLEAAK